MKRGFLKGANLGASSSKQVTEREPPIILPFGKVQKIEVPKGFESNHIQIERDAAAESHPAGMTWTSLPIDTLEDTECYFFPGSKEVFTRLPGFPHPMRQPAERAFLVADSPGKGLGLFSTRALAQGELILSDRPLLITPAGTPTKIPSTFTREQAVQHILNENEKYLEYSVNRMRDRQKAAFLALANCHKEDGSGPLVGIVRTNGVGVAGLRPGVGGKAGMYTAVCEYISRLNHCCSPNTARVFDKYSLSFRVYAVRDIAKGEELTLQYIDTLEDAATRQEDLRPYGVVCTCSACTQPTAESDARRKAIEQIGNIKRADGDDLHSIIDTFREQLKLIEREGLEHLELYPKMVKAVMGAYIRLGDAASTSEWAAKVFKCAGWADDNEGVEVAET